MIVGIDPGIVNTGCVRLIIQPEKRRILKEHAVFVGLNVGGAYSWVMRFGVQPDLTVIEQYEDRKNYAQNAAMLGAQQEFKKYMPNPILLRNTGVKQVVPLALLKVFDMAWFSVRTHHNDLLSAARILIAGMSRDRDLNLLLADAVKAHLDGNPFEIIDLENMDDLPE